jgi:hypothetical protein
VLDPAAFHGVHIRRFGRVLEGRQGRGIGKLDSVKAGFRYPANLDSAKVGSFFFFRGRLGRIID